jgi:hypothetical protein
MATRIGDYKKEITDLSKIELLSLARWFTDPKFVKYKPFLVGGWAVYFHTISDKRPAGLYDEAVFNKSRFDDPSGFSPLGSKDIDLLFPDAKSRDSFEYYYCKEHGYTKEGFGAEKFWVKHKTGSDDSGIILDLLSLSEKWSVRGSAISWDALPAHSVPVDFGNGLSMACPEKELLLLYKCVALVQRTDRKNLPNPSPNLDSKIWKDANDILALHDTGIDEKKLASIAKETGLEPILTDAKALIAASYESYGFTQYAFKDNLLKTE